jgi:hypothetical protein
VPSKHKTLNSTSSPFCKKEERKESKKEGKKEGGTEGRKGGREVGGRGGLRRISVFTIFVELFLSFGHFNINSLH